MPSRRQLVFGIFSRPDRRPPPAEAAASASPVVETPALPRLVSFAEHCLAFQNVVCRSCGERCEVDAIRFSPRLGGAARPLLVADRCTGCGDCVPVCPTAAISLISAATLSTRTSEEFVA